VIEDYARLVAEVRGAVTKVIDSEARPAAADARGELLPSEQQAVGTRAGGTRVTVVQDTEYSVPPLALIYPRLRIMYIMLNYDYISNLVVYRTTPVI
jgi:hypothetical protein